jgi:hypothetical protein
MNVAFWEDRSFCVPLFPENGYIPNCRTLQFRCSGQAQGAGMAWFSCIIKLFVVTLPQI